MRDTFPLFRKWDDVFDGNRDRNPKIGHEITNHSFSFITINENQPTNVQIEISNRDFLYRISMTRNQNQLRLCWPICLVLLGRCASLVIPSRGFQHRIPNSFSLELSRVFTSKLHSTSPMSYEELSNEPLVEQQKSTVIDNKLSSSSSGLSFE